MDSKELTGLFSEFPPITTEEWEARINADLKGADYQKKLVWKTYDGIDIKPYYRSADLMNMAFQGIPPDREPFIGGSRTAGQHWQIHQDFMSEDIDELNHLIRNAITKGVNSFGIRGRQINTHRQMEELLKGIDLGSTAINFIASSSYPLTLELLIYEVIHREINPALPGGSLNFDPIGYLLVKGDFYTTWAQNLEEAEYLLQTASSKLPSFRVVNINAQYFQDAGSTLVQELAFGLASACEYMAGLTDKGMHIDQVAPYMQLSFATGPHYFMEIAKLRAARYLWNRLVEQFNPSGKNTREVFIQSTTANWNKSVFDPYVNMLRTTTEGMSAILGNADAVTIQPFNSPYHDPDEFSSRIARNQQMVLKEESYLDKIVDPAAGSYYIEKLTDSIAHHAWDLFRKVESLGGLICCVKSGFIQDEIERSRKVKEADISQRRLIMLGTNQFPNLQELMADQTKPIAESEERVSTYKKLKPFRAAAGFEQLRLATEQYVREGNNKPKVFLFTMGNLAMLRARAGFAANFFGCAGYEIIDNTGFSTVDEGVRAALASRAEVVVICSSDEEYPDIVPAVASGFNEAGEVPYLVVAGFPKEHIERFRELGIRDFIHVRSDLYDSLLAFQHHLGIMK